MDMKKILQALDGASTKPVEGVNSMAKFLSVVKEAETTVPVTLKQTKAPVKENKKTPSLIKHYFESVQSEAEQALAQRRAKIKEQARRIAQRMREDAKVTAIDPAKKTITYTDDQTGISTTVPQAMAKPGEGGQVMIDKSQVNQAVGQEQQPPAIKVGDMIKMMDTESSSAGVRMQRALQREKEKREFSQRYAEKNFPIGKKPEPIKDQGVAEVSQQTLQSYRKKASAQKRAADDVVSGNADDETWKKNVSLSAKRRQGIDAANKRLSVAEGNEDPSWMDNLRLKK